MSTKKLNQKGQVLIAVMVLSIVFIVGYAGFQTYFRTLANTQAKYREAINLMNAVDKASADIRASWDKASTDAYTTWLNSGPPPAPPVGPPPTPKVINDLILSKLSTYLPPLDPSCSVGAGCTGAGCCPATAALCYNNPNNSSFPYCFFSGSFVGGTTTLSSLDFRMIQPHEKKNSTLENYLDKTGEMIATLVHKVQGHGLIEDQSFAALQVIQNRNDSVGAAPSCLTATCIKCGLVANGPTAPVCATIYACPSAYPQCRTYNKNPTAAGAAFIQQFSLTPSGGS